MSKMKTRFVGGARKLACGLARLYRIASGDARKTFPFTQYSTIHGRIAQVSSDANDDETRGLIYSARVRSERTTMHVEGKAVNLRPGIAVTGDQDRETAGNRVFPEFLDSTRRRESAREVMRPLSLEIFRIRQWLA